jgi:UrcA family protein
MSTQCNRSAAALAICVALAGVLLPAQADTGVRVKFRDLDLSSPKGIATLYQRIERAARLVCTDSSAPWDGERVTTFQRCYDAAIEDAVATIDQPMLTALHRAKNEQHPPSSGTTAASTPGK